MQAEEMTLNTATQDKVVLKIFAKDEALIPHYHTLSSAGADLRACIDEPIVLNPSAVELIPTGIYFEIPHGYEVQIRPRSGLALKNHITVLNTPGTIDADYRGEIKVMLINHSKEPFIIEPRMRIAQMILAPIAQASFYKVDSVEALEKSNRSLSGFGSTGLH